MDTTIAYALKYSQETLGELAEAIAETHSAGTREKVNDALAYVKAVRKLMSYSDETCKERARALRAAKQILNGNWNNLVNQTLKSQMSAVVRTIDEALS